MTTENLAIMDDKKALALNTLLTDLEKSGHITVAELRPSLNALLSDPKEGGTPGRVFLGEIKSFQKDVEMDSMNGDKHSVDVVELQDLSGDFQKETFAFSAGNGGLKAKLRKIEGQKYALILYRGEMERTNPKWNAPKDYGIIGAVGAEGLEGLKGFYIKAKALTPSK